MYYNGSILLVMHSARTHTHTALICCSGVIECENDGISHHSTQYSVRVCWKVSARLNPYSKIVTTHTQRLCLNKWTILKLSPVLESDKHSVIMKRLCTRPSNSPSSSYFGAVFPSFQTKLFQLNFANFHRNVCALTKFCTPSWCWEMMNYTVIICTVNHVLL